MVQLNKTGILHIIGFALKKEKKKTDWLKILIEKQNWRVAKVCFLFVFLRHLTSKIQQRLKKSASSCIDQPPISGDSPSRLESAEMLLQAALQSLLRKSSIDVGI